MSAASALRREQAREGPGEGHADAEGRRRGVLEQPAPAALPVPRLARGHVLRALRVLQGGGPRRRFATSTAGFAV